MLLSNLNLLAKAPGGVARLRELILTLAVQGKLVPQDPKDEPASELLKKIRAEKDRLIAEGKIKRDKPLAEIAEEEKPFELPAGWEWVRFGGLPFSAHTGLDRGRDLQSDSRAYPYFKMNNIANSGGTNFANMTRVDANPEELEKFKLRVGDFLFNTRNSRELVGKTCVIDGLLEENTIFNNNILVSRFHGLIDAKFIDTWFRSPVGQLGLDRIKSATTNVCAIYQGNLFEFLCALPPISEQSRIVTRVEELMRLCDALEAKAQLQAAQHAQLVSTLLGTLTASTTPQELADNWQRVATHFDLLLDRPEAVDALEQTILQLAVRGLLVPQDPQDEPAAELLKKIRAEKDKLIVEGKIKRDKPLPPIAEDEQPFALPLGWEWARLGDVSKVISGYAFSSEDFSAESGIRAIKITNAGVGEFHATDDYLPPSFAEGFDSFKAAKNDLILALTRPYVSSGLKISRCPTSYDGALINQRVAAIRCSASIDYEFAFAYMQSADVLSVYQNRFNGSGLQPNLKVSDVTELALPLPPIAEQSRIVTRVAQLRRLCADLRQRLTTAQSTQSHLAQALVEVVPE